jgi:hypothetical protein
MQLKHASNATASSALADAGDGLAPEAEEAVQLPYLLVSGHKNWAEAAAATSVAADAARRTHTDCRRVAMPEYQPLIPRVNTEETHPAMLIDGYVEGGIKAVLYLLLQQEHLQVTT